MEKRYKKFYAIMVLCFLFGGFAIISYAIQAYSAFLQPDLMPAIRGELDNSSYAPRDFNGTAGLFNETRANRNPSNVLLSPMSLALFFAGAISISAGFAILGLVREKEIKFTKKTVMDAFLTPEEKAVVEEIEKLGGAAKQNELAKNTCFSRVKIHRVIKNLEKKNILMKQEYGMTNKIVLKK